LINLFPTLKKVIDACVQEGLLCRLFAEGSYNTRLDYVDVFSQGQRQLVFRPDRYGQGQANPWQELQYPGQCALFTAVTGSPADVKEYCRKLIETCAPGGGYILAAGCTPENPKLEN
jgi:hypothetical protein